MIQFLIDPLYMTWLFVGGSVALIVATVPLLLGKIRPNPLYGFRIPQTLSNERIWYLANAYCAKWTIWTGTITIICAVAFRLMSIPPLTYQWTCTVILVGGLIVSAVASMIYVTRIS